MTAKSVFFLFVIIICVVLLASYAFTGDFKFWEAINLAITPKTGVLQVGGTYPRVERVFMNQTPTAYECTYIPYACTMDSFSSTTRPTRINATIEDDNGDCEGTTVTYWICPGLVPVCENANDIYTGSLISPSKYTIGSCVNCYCNFTNTFNLQFWQKWGNYTINITVRDATQTTWYNYTNRTWYYNPSPSLDYPVGGSTIVLGSITTLGQWYFGMGANATRNTGNIRLNLTFNATNFTRAGGGIINVHDNNFTVQNISGNPFSPATINNYKNMSANDWTIVEFFPTNGMYRCGSDTCDQDQYGRMGQLSLANYTLWWSVNTPLGIPGGLYTNGIDVGAWEMRLGE